MKYMNLLSLFWKFGMIVETEYRSNFIIHIFETVIKFLTGISVLWAVLSRTSTIGDWNWNQLLIVLGLWFVMSGMVNMIIAPSMKQFMNDVWKGTLDYVLIKPQNHQFMASTRKVEVFQSVDMLIGLTVMIIGMIRLGATIGMQHAFMFAVTLFCGAVIIYSFWVALGAVSIWMIKMENIVLVFYAMFEAGRWPATLYPYWLRFSMIFLVPIALAITVPAQAIIGRLSWMTLLFSCLWAVLTFTASRAFFNFGVRHRYMGASA
jgi:ABC-2 type transport system permease protein